MAFPTVQTADTQSGVVTSNSTSWTLTYPTNLVSGDLILAFLGSDGNQTGGGTWPSGFVTTPTVSGGNASLVIAKKVSDGTETGSFSVTGLASEQGGWRTIRVTGWEGTLGTSWGNSVNSGSVLFLAAAIASSTPNPPALDPANWDVEDTLWIAACAVDTSRTFSAWPTSYLPGNNTWDNVSGGAGGASLSVQYRQNAVASEDPGTFTISTSDDWSCVTIGIRPAAPVAPVPRHPGIDHMNPGLLAKAHDAWERTKGGILVPRLWTPEGAVI